MKQLTCEMCGSTDLTKQDGVFVCQTCGCKYSVEEAKKMMVEGTVEVQGTVNVQNAAQMESLLKLARSSFASKNYAQAEQFCNQVISMDSQNYEAWKLKGESINYQISTKNPRILEVYNCIMTSYRVLSDDAKEGKKKEITTSLCTCLEGEINFWLEQFGAQRPTEALLERVKQTFLDCATKAINAFREFGYSDEYISAYARYLQKDFVRKAIDVCNDTWEKKVYHNYWRGGFTDEYHPTDEIFTAYVDEASNLTSLMRFCTEQFNDEIPPSLRIDIYENMIHYHTKLCEAKSYKRMASVTTNGYGAVVKREEHWEIDSCLTDEAIAIRKQRILEYETEIEHEFEKDCTTYNLEELLELAKDQLDDALREEGREDYDDAYAHYRYARCGYSAAINRDSACSIAYLGKAVALAQDSDNWPKVLENIILASKHQIKNEDQKYVPFLINFKGRFSRPLLICAVKNFSYEATLYLIGLGADVNMNGTGVDSSVCTPLWWLTQEPLPPEKAVVGRRIAKLLIDKGANLEISSGVALYTDKTDPEIAQMIRAKNPALKKGKSTQTGCYVATAVYGSYDCPQVWTLRRYRDYTLAETWYGRAFIHLYYAISPTLVKWFGHTEWFKTMWKGKLDRMVADLNAEGVEDTPYEDKNW